MLGWLGIFAGLFEWGKETYQRNQYDRGHYGTPEMRARHAKASLGAARLHKDLDARQNGTLDYWEFSWRSDMGYYEGKDVNLDDYPYK